MAEIEIKPNQAALILGVLDDGEISIDLAFPEESTDENELASAICEAIANKLVHDEDFLNDILVEIQEDETGSGNA